MARVTKGMIKAQQRAMQAYKQKYRSVLKRIGTPVLFRLGVMNFLACEELRNAEDMMESMDGFMEHYEKIKPYMLVGNEYVKARYAETPEVYPYFTDTCNHAYAELEDAIEKMRSCIRVKMEELKTSNPDVKAQIGVVMLLIMLAIETYKSLRKRILVKEKIDINDELKCLNLEGAEPLWTEVVLKYSKMPEAKEPVDIWRIEGFADAYNEFHDIAASDHFLNDCCRWAAALNKEYMPELYNNLLKEIEETE